MNNYLKRNKFKDNITSLRNKKSILSFKETNLKKDEEHYNNDENTKNYFLNMENKYNKTMRNTFQNYNIIKRKEKNYTKNTLIRNTSMIKHSSSRNFNVISNKGIKLSVIKNDFKEINYKYKIIKNLGKGSFSTTYLVSHLETEELYALKELKNNNEENIKEINILKNFDHKNIIKYYENFEFENKNYFVLEYAGDRSLNDYINTKTNHRLNELEAKFIFKQIINSINYLHNKGFAHCDLKLDNIIFNKENGIIKIIDFGFCNKIEKTKEFIGTLQYMSYEILTSKIHYNHYDDMWALGIILFKLIYSIFPFKGKNKNEILNKIKTKKNIFPPSIETSKEIKNLISGLLNINYKKRLLTDDIIFMFN